MGQAAALAPSLSQPLKGGPGTSGSWQGGSGRDSVPPGSRAERVCPYAAAAVTRDPAFSFAAFTSAAR